MARNDVDGEMFTVTVAMEIEAESAQRAAREAKGAVNLRKNVDRGRDTGDVYVQRVERPLKRVEEIQVIKTDETIDD